MNKYLIINDHNNFLHILVCVALLHRMAPARCGQDKAVAPPPPGKSWFSLCHIAIGGLFATFSFMWVLLLRFSHYWGLHGIFFWSCPPPPYENFCGRPCYTVSINFFSDTRHLCEKWTHRRLFGRGGVHGKVCWIIAYILLQWCKWESVWSPA